MQLIVPTQSELEELGITGAPLGVISPESAIAHRYLDGLKGVEVGAASYQPFGLDSINVATADKDDRELYKRIQIHVCGSYVSVDIEAEADQIPLVTASQDYVIASHVLEHISNPITALMEWDRITKRDGYIYLIVPKREGLYGDSHRRITPTGHFHTAYRDSWSNKAAYLHMQDRPAKDFDRMRGHIWVFNLLSLCSLVDNMTNELGFINWKLVEAHETDDKDGMGHMAVFRNER